jgi:hypothetical protein
MARTYILFSHAAGPQGTGPLVSSIFESAVGAGHGLQAGFPPNFSTISYTRLLQF